MSGTDILDHEPDGHLLEGEVRICRERPSGPPSDAMAITEVLESIIVLSQRLYERVQKMRKERKAREKVREEGREEGRLEVQTAIQIWNQQRLEAEARGEPFDVPFPTFDDRG